MERTFRITPNPAKYCKVAKNDIDLKYIEKTFIKNPRYRKFIISREYKDKKDKFSLHYHGYFDTTYSRNTVRGHIKGICKKQYKGNEYLSISEKVTIIEHARNYICKDDDVVIYKGFTKKDIENFIKGGKEYKEKKKLYKMSWMQRIWHYIDEKGYKQKLLDTYNKKKYFIIEKHVLPIVFKISEDLEINPPPPHIYQQMRMSVLRVLFPKAFRQWYTTYIEDACKFKGSKLLINPQFSLSYSDSETEEESDELEPQINEI